MGIRSLFSRGGQNFQKTLKKIQFSSKIFEKHTILVSQEGATAPYCPPLRTPMLVFKKKENWEFILYQNVLLYGTVCYG